MPKSGVVVFKIGGEILRLETLLSDVINEIAALKIRSPNTRLVLVHGAGPQLDQRLAEAQILFKKIGGKRVTSEAAMQVIWNLIREESNALAQKLVNRGVKAEVPEYPVSVLTQIKDKRLGFVGSPIGVNLGELNRLFRKQAMPIVSICGRTKKRPDCKC